MKAHFRFLCLSFAMLFASVASRAQLTGSHTVPSTYFPTLKKAIDSLNQVGVGAGGATINFTAGTNETAPAGGYRLGSTTLNGSLSSANPLTISGNANNITAYTGTGTADGIFFLQGTNYVTINNLNLLETAANTSSTTRMEWGYALVKLNSSAPYDGCQYNTISGCTITLEGTYSAAQGIRMVHTQAGSTSTLSTGSAVDADANSYNKFRSNIISGVTRGFHLDGISTLARYDKGNEVGGTTLATGNTITLGGSSNVVYGVYFRYDSVITVQNNSISLSSAQSSSAYFIYPQTGGGTMNVLNNSMNVTNNNSITVYCYYNTSYSDAGATYNIIGNSITGSNTSTSPGTFYGFYESTQCNTLNLSSNKITNLSWNSGTMYLEYTYGNSNIPNINVTNNDFYNISDLNTSAQVYGYYNTQYYGTSGALNVSGNRFAKVKNNGIYTYGYYTYGSFSSPYQKITANRNVLDSVDLTGVTSTYHYFYPQYCFYGRDSSEVSYNRITNILGMTSTASLYWYQYMGYGYYAPTIYTNRGNVTDKVTANTCYMYNYFGYYGNVVDSNVFTNINLGANGSATGQIYNYLGMYSTLPARVTRNIVKDITTAGASVYTYMGYYTGSRVYAGNNLIRKVTTGGSGALQNFAGYYASGGVRAERNVIDSLTVSGGTLYGLFTQMSSGSPDTVNNNLISYLGTSGTSSNIYGYVLQNGGSSTLFYNNFYSRPNLPAGHAGTALYPVYLSGANDYAVYHNTIYVNPGITGGGNYSATGLYYSTAVKSLDLRNNIINVNTSPAGTGNVVALRRSGGTAGTVPANFLGTSNSNILYAPNVTGSYAYGEGTVTGTIVNGYNISNDANFNTPCGNFKNFMGHNKSSFIENNLVAGSITNTYVPTGVSYAESNATPTTTPAVTTDYASVTRATLADVGALEFTGTALDNAPPAISYVPIPTKSYCSTAPRLIATITDVTGVNTTTGTAPRLYYKRSTENNTFGGGNTSTTNGWKFVEPTSVSGSQFTFDFDYSLLTGTPGPGDSITYFIIAQDNASTPNAGANIAGFAACPGSVVLGSTHGPLNAAPIPNGFKILNTPTFVLSATPVAVCNSGSGTIYLSPNPVGATIQWQSATLTGTFSNVTGATGLTLNTGLLTTTMRYRALILCGTSTLTTSSIDTFIVAVPTILSTVGDTICGTDTARLTANAALFNVPTWYTTATGGKPFFTGSVYTTPYINSSVTYYVAGNVPNANTETVTKPAGVGGSNYWYTPYYQYGIEMKFNEASTHFYSTTVYPTGSGNLQLELYDPVNGAAIRTSSVFSVTGSGLSTPVVLNLNWYNIPAGTYYLRASQAGTSISGLNLMYEYYYTWPFPYSTPSGNVQITNGLIPSPYNYYYCMYYNNVVSGNCQSATRVPVTATVNPAPAIQASSPNAPGVCTGSSATINVTSAYPYYNYSWTPTGGTSTSFTVTPSATTVYKVVALDPYTLCRTVDSVIINVNPKPAAPIITPTNPTICEGSSVQLTGTPDVGKAALVQVGTSSTSMGAYNYASPYNTYYTAVGHNQYMIRQAEMNAAGGYRGPIKSISFYSDAIWNSGGGYSSMDSFCIRIYQVPSSSANTMSTTCLNPATVTGMTLLGEYRVNSFTPPTTAAGLGWNKFPLSSVNPWNGTSNIIVDIRFINCPGCTPGNYCYNYAYSGAGSVLYTPTSYTSVFTGYAYACDNWTYTPSTYITSSTSRPNMLFDGTSYWDLNWLNTTGLFKNTGLTNAVSLTDTNKVVYSSPAVTTVYTAVTNAAGCLSNPSLPDTVFVNPAPIVTLTPSAAQTICAGSAVTLCVPAAAGVTYQWSNAAGAITGANSNCYNATTAGTYKVTATNTATGCTATSANITVIVNPAPSITIAAGSATTFCNGGNVVLTATAGTTVTYQWQLNGSNITVNGTSATYTATQSGAYTVIVTDTKGCTATSNTINVTVNTTPALVTPSGSKTFCLGGSVTLSAPTGYSYVWQSAPLGSTSFTATGTTTSSYTATASGIYRVIVTNTTTNCSTTSIPDTVVAGSGPSSAIIPSGTIGVCSGSTVTLSTNPAPGLTYQWNVGGSPILLANSSTYTTGTAGSYTVTVTITGAPTCTTTSSTPTVITINPLPTATATAAGPTSFCGGVGSVTLNANTGTGITYQWNLNGIAIAGATASSYSAVSSGSYTVTVTNTATTCSQISNAIVVNANAAPPVTITNTTPTTFCNGGSVVLTASPSTGFTYQWARNGTPITGTPGTGSNITVTTTGLYTVTATSGAGCVATSPSVSVQVNALPDASTTPSSTVGVCQGSTTTISVTNPAPSQSYQWMNNGVAITGATGTTFSTGTAGTYSVRITNTVTSCQSVSGNIPVNVNTLPTASAAATGVTTICQDDSVRLTANTGTGLRYQWRYNGNAIVNDTFSVHQARLSGNYSVAVTNAAGCTAVSTPIFITVNPRPASYITYNTPLDFCEGSAVVLRANPGTNLTYEWLYNGAPLGNATDFNVSSATGKYSLKVTNSFKCVSISDELNVNVFPAPVPSIVQNGGSLSTTTAYQSYQWFFNNTAVGGATTGSFNFTQNGAYKVRVVDANGCEGTSSQFFVNNVGIATTAAGKSIRVYPNPTNGIVKIESSVKVKMNLRDVTGKVILTASDVKEVDLGDVANGIYLLYISDMDGRLLRAEKVTKSSN